ncbi:MAG: hypothetical protein HY720_14040 [Planctomycetes bacterium]|nr:hypothetical protein [Planctomycetota bacterium]
MRAARFGIILVLLAVSLQADEVPLAREAVKFAPGIEGFWWSNYDLYISWHSCEVAPAGYEGDFRSERWVLGEFGHGSRTLAIAFDGSGPSATGFDRVLVDVDGDRVFEADEARPLENMKATLDLPVEDGEPATVRVELLAFWPHLDVPEWLAQVLEGMGPRGQEIEAKIRELVRKGYAALGDLQSREGWPEELANLVVPPEVACFMKVEPADARMGTARIDGSAVRIGVMDHSMASQAGEDPRRLLLVDRDGDGSIAPEETQPLGSLLVLAGTAYRVSLAADARSLSLEPAGVETGVLVVDSPLAGTRLVLDSEAHGRFPVVLAPETRVPVGTYDARYSMARVATDGACWTLSSGRAFALEVGTGRSALEAIDPRIVPAIQMQDQGMDLAFQLALSDGNGIPVSLQKEDATADVVLVVRDGEGNEIFRDAFHPG